MENLNQVEWASGAEDAEAVVIDVRTSEECEEGIVKGAVLIDIYRTEEFMSALNDLDKNKAYYLYCRSGNRSGQACKIMESQGFTRTFNLSGGMLEWEGELVQP